MVRGFAWLSFHVCLVSSLIYTLTNFKNVWYHFSPKCFQNYPKHPCIRLNIAAEFQNSINSSPSRNRPYVVDQITVNLQKLLTSVVDICSRTKSCLTKHAGIMTVKAIHGVLQQWL